MLETALTHARQEIDGFLLAQFDAQEEGVIKNAMKYAVLGGKGIRGFLAIESAALFGVPLSQSIHCAGAVECIHAYSLVHDDLPSMDDDDLRRGKPTVHREWDEAVAVLTGDALQSLAFELLSSDAVGSPAQRCELIKRLAQASGASGMVLGQAQDIAAESSGLALSLEQISALQQNKTGRLLEWPALSGAILADADPAPLLRYAQAIGKAYQIFDDILDVEGDAAKTGKALRKDADAGKATFVSILGLDAARARGLSLLDDARDALHPFGKRAETLRELARFVANREK